MKICNIINIINIASLLMASAAAGGIRGSDVGREEQYRNKASTPNNFSVKSSLSIARNLQQNIRAMTEGCDDLQCAAEGIANKTLELGLMRTSIEEELSPLLSFFGKIQNGQSKIKTVDSMLPDVKLALFVAKQIPKVGVIFSPPYTIVSQIEKPVDTLNAQVSAVTSTTINPLETAANTILNTMQKLEDAVESVSGGISGFEEMAQGQCAVELFSLFAPSFKTAYNSLEDFALETNDILNSFVALLLSLDDALSSKAWRNVRSTVSTVMDGIDFIYKPFNLISPLVNLINEPVTLKWPKIEFKHNAGIPDSCDDGYEKWGLNCVKKCPDGYKPGATPTHCYSKCGDFKDLGLTCENKHYRVRDSKPLNYKFKCSGSKWQKKGALCWKKCPSGWSTKDIGVMICYKNDCPNGMSLDGTKNFCEKKSWNRGNLKPYKCKKGYELIEGFCLKKCNGGTDLRYSCAELESKRFKISQITDKFQDVLETIQNYPIVKEVEGFIEDAVMGILNPVMKELDFLPGKNSIPSLKLPSNLDDILPLDRVKNAMAGAIPENVLEVVDFSNLQDQMMSSLDKIGAGDFLTAINECDDLECLLSAAPSIQNIPDVPLADMEEWLDAVETKISSSALASTLDAINGCAETKTINVPVTDAIAGILGVADEKACDLTFDVCSKVDINQTILDESLRALAVPIMPVVEQLKAAMGGTRRRLRDVTFSTDGRDFKLSLHFNFKDMKKLRLHKLDEFLKKTFRSTFSYRPAGSFMHKEDEVHMKSKMYELITEATGGITIAFGYYSENSDHRDNPGFFGRVEIDAGLELGFRMQKNDLYQTLFVQTKRLKEALDYAESDPCVESHYMGPAGPAYSAYLNQPAEVLAPDCPELYSILHTTALGAETKYIRLDQYNPVKMYPRDNVYWQSREAYSYVRKATIEMEKVIKQIRTELDKLEKRRKAGEVLPSNLYVSDNGIAYYSENIDPAALGQYLANGNGQSGTNWRVGLFANRADHFVSLGMKLEFDQLPHEGVVEEFNPYNYYFNFPLGQYNMEEKSWEFGGFEMQFLSNAKYDMFLNFLLWDGRAIKFVASFNTLIYEAMLKHDGNDWSYEGKTVADWVENW